MMLTASLRSVGECELQMLFQHLGHRSNRDQLLMDHGNPSRKPVAAIHARHWFLHVARLLHRQGGRADDHLFTPMTFHQLWRIEDYASMPASAERPHSSRHRMMYDGKANDYLSFL